MPEDLNSPLDALRGQWERALEIWESGGWAMIAIAVIALVLFSLGMRVLLDLRARRFRKIPERVWRRWVDHPGERVGPLGELLDFATGGRTIDDTRLFFQQLTTTEIVPFERDLRVMRIFVSAAPLVGLLGTVTGMLATFGALASGSGGDKTMGMIAAGISEALVTTETGLVVALPGLFFHSMLQRGLERYKGFLAHLETVCTQVLHRREGSVRDHEVQRAARREIARALRERLRDREDFVIEISDRTSSKGIHGTVQ